KNFRSLSAADTSRRPHAGAPTIDRGVLVVRRGAHPLHIDARIRAARGIRDARSRWCVTHQQQHDDYEPGQRPVHPHIVAGACLVLRSLVNGRVRALLFSMSAAMAAVSCGSSATTSTNVTAPCTTRCQVSLTHTAQHFRSSG